MIHKNEGCRCHGVQKRGVGQMISSVSYSSQTSNIRLEPVTISPQYPLHSSIESKLIFRAYEYMLLLLTASRCPAWIVFCAWNRDGYVWERPYTYQLPQLQWNTSKWPTGLSLFQKGPVPRLGLVSYTNGSMAAEIQLTNGLQWAGLYQVSYFNIIQTSSLHFS